MGRFDDGKRWCFLSLVGLTVFVLDNSMGWVVLMSYFQGF